MKPAVFSLRQNQASGTQWQRKGESIDFSQGGLIKQYAQDRNSCYYCLSFSLNFKYQDDFTYVALNVPYSYSRLLHQLETSERNAKSIKGMYFKQECLATTISGNNCPLVSITAKRGKHDAKKQRKKVIALIGRQHPCQTVGSYVIQGAIKFLLSQTPEAQYLLDKYIFKIIPMLNPDGVVYGNSRCDISGCDVNRQWTDPSRTLHPSVFHAKSLLSKIHSDNYEIDYFVDFHGHSKQMSSLMYIGRDSTEWKFKVLPYLCGRLDSKLFNFQACTYGLSAQKRSTARANVLQYVKFGNAITLQTSFFGYYENEKRPTHFLVQDLNTIGSNLMLAVYMQAAKTTAPTIKQNITINFNNLEGDARQAYQNKSLENGVSRKNEEDDGGSQSEPEAGQLKLQEKAKRFMPRPIAQREQARILAHQQINKDGTRNFMPSNSRGLIQSSALNSVHRLGAEERSLLLFSGNNSSAEFRIRRRAQSRNNVLSGVATHLVKNQPSNFASLPPPKVSASLEKLKVTNPIPFTLSSNRTKELKPTPKRQYLGSFQPHAPQVDRQIFRRSLFTMQAANEPPEAQRLDTNKQSLINTIRSMQRKSSFWDTFRKQLVKVVSQRKYGVQDNAQRSKVHSKLSTDSNHKSVSRIEMFEALQRRKRATNRSTHNKLVVL